MRTEDGHIIRKCLNGDSVAFGFLVDKYKASVYAFAYDRLRNFHDAEDVSQEVFIKAYRNLRSLRNWDSFLAWIYSITSNLCKNWVRAQSRRPDGQFMEDQDQETLEIPSERLYQEEHALEPLNEALDSLPKMYRQVLTLHYLGGMSSMEIARFVGASPAAIRKRLSKARLLLKEEMLAMMSATYQEQRLQATFTFRIVEVVKRLKIQPTPRVNGLPWGLSLAAGIMLAAMALGSQMAIHQFSEPLVFSSETNVAEVREIPVDILGAPGTSAIAGNQGDINGGEMDPRNPQNALLLAPAKEGGTWAEKGEMPTARRYLSTSVVDGKIYAIGGRGGLKKVEEYNPATDTWTEKADMPTGRGYLGTSVVDGKIYAIGGGTALLVGNEFATVEEYDPAINKWAQKADMSTARQGLSTSVVNGKIYAIGGMRNRVQVSTVEEYDPATDTWTKKADMPTARSFLSTSVVNGKIYAVGGMPRNANPALSTVEEYDPVADKWTKKADMPAPSSARTSVVDGKIYAFGGVVGKGGLPLSTLSQYDPATDTWTEKDDMPVRVGGMGTSAVDGRIYVIGGSSAGFPYTPYLSTVWEYDPGFVPAEEAKSAVKPKGKLFTPWGKIRAAE